MALSWMETRKLAHRSATAATEPAVAAFVAEDFPEAKAEEWTTGRYTADQDGPPKYSVTLVTQSTDETAGGFEIHGTTVHFEVLFREPAEPAEQAAAEAHLERLLTLLEARFVRDVPVEFAAAKSQRDDLVAPAATLASLAADHLGKSEIFRELIQTGTWNGVITHAGVPVHLHLNFPRATTEADGHTLAVDAGVATTDMTRHGAAAAQEAVDAVVESLVERIERQLAVSPPDIDSRALHAQLKPMPRLFYGAFDAVNTFAESLGLVEVGWKDGGRAVILAPEPDTRVELLFNIDTDADGATTAKVMVGLDRVGTRLTDETVAQWQQTLDAFAAGLVGAAEAQGVAPSFGIRAPRDSVVSALRRQLVEMFPSDAPDVTDAGVAVHGFMLGEDVWATVEVIVVAVSEWDTQLTFTGSLWGSGIGDDPRAIAEARSRFRDVVARAANEIRAELEPIAIVPSTRPDAGMDL